MGVPPPGFFSYNLECKRWWSNDLIGHAQKNCAYLTLSVNKSRPCFMWDCIWCLKIWSLSAEPIERYIQVFAFHKLRFFCWIRSAKFYCYITIAKFLHCMCSTCFVALRTKYFTFIVQYFTSWLKERGKTPPYDHPVYTITSLLQPYRAYSLTWHSSMLIYTNKRKFLHKRRVQFLQSCLCKPTLFWNTNMAAVMSSEYALFDPNVKSLSHLLIWRLCY